MAIRIDGKKIARETLDALAPRIEGLRAKGVTPGLTVILVGNNPASEIYVASKERTAGELGLDGKVIRMSADTTQEALEEQVRSLNDDPAVHGILVQLPLPAQIDESKILRAIAPEKDVDGFHAVNAGRLFQGQESMVPCTPLGVIRLLDSMGIEIEGKEAVVVGRSNIVGKPMAMLLLERNATVTVAHSRSKNLAEITRRADILVVAIGRYKQITADMIKPGAAVIDVGTNRIGGKKVRGDVDFDAAERVAGWITPVPGGVGAMTIALLMENTVLAAERFAAKNGK